MKLEIQMQHFLAFIQSCQNNRSPHDSSPPDPPPPPAMRYSRVKIFHYFLTVRCVPATLGGHWHHRIRCTHQPHIRLHATNTATPHSTWTTENIRGTQQKAEHLTAPVVSAPTHTRAATWPTTAHTKPPYNDTISTKDTRVFEARPLTGPMISYCPPWPPPHRKCWYSTNIDMNLQRSQPKS